MRWTAGDEVAEARIDLAAATWTVRYTQDGRPTATSELLDLPGSALAPPADRAEDRSVESGEVE
jgi:hypothetical protein